MTIKENIEKQVNAGFSKEEIIANLKAEGYDALEIEQETLTMPSIPSLANTGYDTLNTNSTENKGPNAKSILMGILFIGLGVTRLAGVRGGGSDLSMIIGVILIGFGLFRLIAGFMGK